MHIRQSSKSRVLLEMIHSYTKSPQELELLERSRQKAIEFIENTFAKSRNNQTYVFPRKRDIQFLNDSSLDSINQTYHLDQQNINGIDKKNDSSQYFLNVMNVLHANNSKKSKSTSQENKKKKIFFDQIVQDQKEKMIAKGKTRKQNESKSNSQRQKSKVKRKISEPKKLRNEMMTESNEAFKNLLKKIYLSKIDRNNSNPKQQKQQNSYSDQQKLTYSQLYSKPCFQLDLLENVEQMFKNRKAGEQSTKQSQEKKKSKSKNQLKASASSKYFTSKESFNQIVKAQSKIDLRNSRDFSPFSKQINKTLNNMKSSRSNSNKYKQNKSQEKDKSREKSKKQMYENKLKNKPVLQQSAYNFLEISQPHVKKKTPKLACYNSCKSFVLRQKYNRISNSPPNKVFNKSHQHIKTNSKEKKSHNLTQILKNITLNKGF